MAMCDELAELRDDMERRQEKLRIILVEMVEAVMEKTYHLGDAELAQVWEKQLAKLRDLTTDGDLEKQADEEAIRRYTCSCGHPMYEHGDRMGDPFGVCRIAGCLCLHFVGGQ